MECDSLCEHSHMIYSHYALPFKTIRLVSITSDPHCHEAMASRPFVSGRRQPWLVQSSDSKLGITLTKRIGITVLGMQLIRWLCQNGLIAMLYQRLPMVAADWLPTCMFNELFLENLLALLRHTISVTTFWGSIISDSHRHGAMTSRPFLFWSPVTVVTCAV